MLLPLPSAANGLNLAYQPMRADWSLNPAETMTATVQLKNQGAEDVHLRARVVDFFVSDDNTPQFVADSDDGYSCRSWTILNPVEVDIDGDSVATFRYTLRAPENLPSTGRTYRCALMFESMPTLADRLARRSMNQMRLVTVIYATVGTPEATPGIGTPELTTSDWMLRVPFSNLGETHYRLTGTVRIAAEDAGVVQEMEMDSSPIHPGTQVQIPYSLQPLNPGSYRMTIRLRFGDRILEKETFFEIPPPDPTVKIANDREE